MNKKVTGIVCYITLIGWLIAFLAGDREGARFHLNQGLVLVLAGVVGGIVGTILGFIPIVGWILGLVIDIFLFVCMILGIINAVQEQEKQLPLIGGITLLK